VNNLWQFVQQNPRLIFVVLLIGLPILRAVSIKLSQQAAIRRAEIERERREIERLRTGRMETESAAGGTAGPVAARTSPARTPAPSARATLEEMAAKRRGQIEEMRRRRAAAGAGTIASPGPQASRPETVAMPMRIPGSTGPTVPGTRGKQPGQRPAKQRQAAASPVPIDPRTVARDAARKRAPDGGVARRREREIEAVAQAQRDAVSRQVEQEKRDDDRRQKKQAEMVAVPSASPAPTRGVRAPILGRHLTRAEWRRAFVMQELLSPPVSLRPGP